MKKLILILSFSFLISCKESSTLVDTTSLETYKSSVKKIREELSGKDADGFFRAKTTMEMAMMSVSMFGGEEQALALVKGSHGLNYEGYQKFVQNYIEKNKIKKRN